jgi:tetratricopeptide (TPR) repeat protein
MAKTPKKPVDNVLDPDKMDPQTNEEYLERGWLYYSHEKYERAEADINAVLQNEPDNVDAWYALGLVWKAIGNLQRAVEAFSKIDSVIAEIDEHQRATIISRLAHGQINQIQTGNWDLEKEVWKK